MGARCRCGDPIEWHIVASRRAAYDPDGYPHECVTEPAVATKYDIPRREATLTQPPPNADPPRHQTTIALAALAQLAADHLPKPTDDLYDHVIALAARYGCRERDLAWNIAYRAALNTGPTTQTAS